jgi:GTP-binding protein HflX
MANDRLTAGDEEKALLVGIYFFNTPVAEAQESIDELEALAKTAGAEVQGKILQRRERPDSAILIGKGKAREIEKLVERDGIDLVIFDHELTPYQQRNLEELFSCKVLDRTALILDIFAIHAHTREGKTQVELAQLNYLLSRLTGRGTQLSRLGGGIGTRGPGETKLEVDRRRIRQRIKTLREELRDLERVRRVKRKRRAKRQIFSFSLVGYTNAGKSSLLNRLTRASAVVEDKLFSTLDSTTRRVRLTDSASAVLTDTVGFINKLPHQLVEAFKSTLEEVRDSDMIIHVIDATQVNVEKKVRAVIAVLEEIGAEGIPRLDVVNKIDLCDEARRRELSREFPDALQISALTGEGVEELRERLQDIVEIHHTLPTLKFQ